MIRLVALNNQLILIGFMGVGKTSVGQCLSQRLSMSFIDLDAHIQSQHGGIPHIFEVHGEAYFRGLEYESISNAINQNIGVISTGGGIVTHDPSFLLLKQCTRVVWLRASLETVSERIRLDDLTLRPLADDQLIKRYHDRQSFYDSCASFTVVVDDVSAEEVAEIIINRYR